MFIFYFSIISINVLVYVNNNNTGPGLSSFSLYNLWSTTIWNLHTEIKLLLTENLWIEFDVFFSKWHQVPLVKVIQVWNSMRVTKKWNNFYVWVKFCFKISVNFESIVIKRTLILTTILEKMGLCVALQSREDSSL